MLACLCMVSFSSWDFLKCCVMRSVKNTDEDFFFPFSLRNFFPWFLRFIAHARRGFYIFLIFWKAGNISSLRSITTFPVPSYSNFFFSFSLLLDLFLQVLFREKKIDNWKIDHECGLCSWIECDSGICGFRFYVYYPHYLSLQWTLDSL